MLNRQLSTKNQNGIRNASDRVVVVAARSALNEYLKYSAYICQPHRTFQDSVRMAFYTKNKIDRRIPKILEQIEAISRDEIDTRTNLTDTDRARLKTLLSKLDSPRSEEWRKNQLKMFSYHPPTLRIHWFYPTKSPTTRPLQAGKAPHLHRRKVPVYGRETPRGSPA